MSQVDFGGHIRFTYDGSPLIIRTEVSIEPVDEDVEVVVNQNGSVDVTGKPKGFRWKAKFKDSTGTEEATSFDWNSWFKGPPKNIAFIEDETNVVHLFTACKVFGKISINRLDGEVDGVEGASSVYTRTGG